MAASRSLLTPTKMRPPAHLVHQLVGISPAARPDPGPAGCTGSWSGPCARRCRMVGGLTQEDVDAGNARSLGLQLADDLRRRRACAAPSGLSAIIIRRAGWYRPSHWRRPSAPSRRDIRIVAHDLGHLLGIGHHLLDSEVPLAACMLPWSRPVSSLGRKSCGISANSPTLASRLATNRPRIDRPVLQGPSAATVIGRLHAVEARFAPAIEAVVRSPCSSLAASRAQSIGVSVTETMPENTIARMMVTANSCSSRPTMPPMNTIGMNTAASDRS